MNKNLRDMKDKKRKSNICVIGIPERFNRGDGAKSIFKNLIAILVWVLLQRNRTNTCV